MSGLDGRVDLHESPAPNFGRATHLAMATPPALQGHVVRIKRCILGGQQAWDQTHMMPMLNATVTPIFSRSLSLTSRRMAHGSAARTKSMRAFHANNPQWH